MSKYFDMTDLGLLINYCLVVEVWKIGRNIFVSQEKYVKDFLDRFRMTICKILSTFMEKGLKLSSKNDSKVVNESIYR
jgi:hypothetical protein